jgi:myosin heavy subunit
MLGLQRIVLHHSYLPNKSTAIECAGNTNISGDNGTGKTSALNLIPIFFGEQSDRLVSRAGGKKDFLDYYLPTSASLIGFDYLREDGPKCVVLYRIQRSEGARLAYRFIDSCFTGAFLTKELKPKLLQGLAITEAIAEVTQSGIDVSNQLLTVMDYRAIIQQDERLLKRGGRVQKALKATAKRFCLGGPNSKMSHMDRLTYAILKRSSMFSRLKSMIADTFFEDIALGDKPEHFKNPELIDNIQHIRSFLEHRPQFQRCIQTASDRVRIAIQIHQFKQALDQAITEQRRVQHDLENELDALKTRYRHLENERDDRLQTYQSEVKDHKDSCGRFERELNLLHQQKTEWEERNITYKVSELEALADYQEQYQQALGHWRQLKEGTQKPDAERVEAKQLAAEAFEQLKQRTDDKIDKLKEQLSALEQQGAKAREQILLDKHDHHQGLMQSLETEHSTLLTALNKAQWQQEHMQPNEEEHIKQEAINQQIEQLEHQIDLKDSQRDDVLSKQQAAKTAYTQAVEQLEEAEQRLNHIKSQAQQLQQQLYPADGSLLSALRAQDPEWGQGIGKILPRHYYIGKISRPNLLKTKTMALYWGGR